jgi:Spy/CpxP family protein refolding chaperone
MKTFKSLLLLALVFVAGIAVGMIGTRLVVRHMVQTAISNPGEFQSLLERNLSRKLRLEPRQQLKLREILTQTHAQMSDLRREYRPQMLLILTDADNRITNMLTPQQRARYERMKAENRALFHAAETNR